MSRRIERRIGISIAAVLILAGGAVAFRARTMEKTVEVRIDLWPPGGRPDRTIRSVNGKRVTLPADGWTMWIDDRPFETFPVTLTLDDMREVPAPGEGEGLSEEGWCEVTLREAFGLEGRMVSHFGAGNHGVLGPKDERLLCFSSIGWMHPGRRYDSFVLCAVVPPDRDWARAALVRLAREHQLALGGLSGTEQDDDDTFWDGFVPGVRVYRRTGAKALSASYLALSASGIPTETDAWLRAVGAGAWYLDGR